MKIRKTTARGTRVLLMCSSIVVLIGGYTYLSHRRHEENPQDRTMPTWTQLYDGVTRMVSVDPTTHTQWLVTDTIATLKRICIALLLTVLLGLIIGVHMGSFPWVEHIFKLPFSWAAQLPPTAMFAVFFIILGTDEALYPGIIMFGILPTLTMTIFLGMKDVHDEIIFKGYTLGGSNLQIVWGLMVPQLVPKIIEAVVLSIGPALVVLVAAEYNVGEMGFGYRIRLLSKRSDNSIVFPYITLLGLYGYMLKYGLVWLQRKMCPWFVKEQ